MSFIPLGRGETATPYLTRHRGIYIEAGWDRQHEAHMLVVGRTTTGKTTLLRTLALGALAASDEVYLLDGKGRGNFAVFAGRARVAAVENEALAIADALDHVHDLVQRRYRDVSQAMSRAVQHQQRPDFEPPGRVCVLLDEYINLLFTLPKHRAGEVVGKLMATAMLAAEAGVHLVLATQAPNAEQSTAILPTPLRQQLGLRVLLGAQEPAAKRIAFGDYEAEIPDPLPIKGRAIAAITGGIWVEVQTYHARDPVSTDPEVTDAQRAAAWAWLPPKVERAGAFGLRAVKEVG